MVPDGFVVVPQAGGGLDERLANAFAAVTGPGAARRHGHARRLEPSLLDAIERSAHPGTDAVLGPGDSTAAGGPSGCAAPIHASFIGVPMSTAHTFVDQVHRLVALGLRTALLPTVRDFDLRQSRSWPTFPTLAWPQRSPTIDVASDLAVR